MLNIVSSTSSKIFIYRETLNIWVHFLDKCLRIIRTLNLFEMIVFVYSIFEVSKISSEFSIYLPVFLN